MKRTTFIAIFMSAHLCFIFLQIHKHTQFIKQSFAKQKNERLLASLEIKKQQLIQELHSVKNHANIGQFAKNNLNMGPVRLSQIKKVKHDQPSV